MVGLIFTPLSLMNEDGWAENYLGGGYWDWVWMMLKSHSLVTFTVHEFLLASK